MSHRRWRKNLAPGVSPGIHATRNNQALEEGDSNFLPPLRGSLVSFLYLNPGLTPGATNMSPANAGSFSMISIAVSDHFSSIWQTSFSIS